jgi:pyruvate/2-oxoglutarate dehydrogenase complex dihydrolipoamide acyltransferase (E2) component
VSSSSTDALVDVTMPQMGVSVAEGTVVEWRKQPGDWVEADEVIAAISTDKIDTDVESPASGRVEEILVPVGETVEVGTVLARITTDAQPGQAHAAEADDNGGQAQADARPQQGQVTEADVALGAPGDAGDLQGDTRADHDASVQEGAARRPGGRRRYSPVVARMAAEHGLDLERIEGTGRGGRVRKQDVLAYLEREGADGGERPEPPMHIESPYRPEPPAPSPEPAPEPAPAAGPSPEPAPEPAAAGGASAPLSRMRQSIGRRMVESLRTSATCTTIIEADMTRADAERRRLGTTFLPVIARATIDTLRAFPHLNATLENDTITRYDPVHLGIAVSLGEGGLIVPVIRDAQELSVEGLAARIKDLARRARENALSPDEVRGGTFTITNPGGYGSIIATPVINQPQVAILDTEAVVKRPVVVTDEHGQDAIAIRQMTYLCMSWDHRALDGAMAAQFLRALADRLQGGPPAA